MEYVDVLIANEEDAEKVFGIKAANTDITAAQYRKTMAEPQNAKNEEFSREKSFDFFQNL